MLNKDIADYDEAINRAIDYLIHGKPAEKATETKKPMPEEREKPPRIKETNRLTLPVEKLAADYKARGMDKYRAWDQFIIDRALKPEIDAREFYQIVEEVSPNLIRDGFTGEIVPTHIIKHVGGREMKVMLLEEDDKKITWVEEHRMTGTSFKKDLEIFEEIKPEEPTPPSITKAEDITEDVLLSLNEKMLGLGAPIERDDVGYNKIDHDFAMQLYDQAMKKELTKAQFAALANMLAKYGKTQLGIDPELLKAAAEQIAASETRETEEAEIHVEPTMTIEESLEQGKLPKAEQTVVDNIRSGYGKYKKTVLQLSIDSKGVLVVDYAPFDRTGDTSIQHKLEHGFVSESGKIKFIGQAEEITKRVGKITGQTYDIKDWLKSLGFKWNGRTKTWEGVVKSEQKDQKVVAPITGLDYRLPLRSSEDYGRIIVTRGKRLEGTGTSDISEKTKRVLREHQIDGVNLAVAAIDKYGGFLLADGTGAGKTMQELAVAEHYSRKGNNVLIVTVNRQVINTAFKEQAKMLGLTVNEVTAKLGHGINITTYASLDKLTENPDYIIFDEAHSMKNYKISTRAKKGIALAQKAKGVLYATATPFDKAEHIKYLDRLAIFERKSFSKIMDALGYKYQEKRIGHQTVGEWVRNVSLEEAEERLSNLFGELSELGLVIKREISMDKVAVEFKQVSLPSEVQTELDKIEEHYDRTVSMPGLKRALTLMAQRRFQEPYKVNAVIKLVEEELKAGKQVVVFATRIEDAEIEDAKIADDVNKMASEGTLKTLTSLLESKGIKVARIYGSGNVESQVKAFQEGKKQVALVTPQKGGAGLSLDDTAGDKPRTMVVITPPFSGVDNVQMAGRINRLNTKSNSKIVYLLADTSIDAWNKEIIVNKMKTLKAIVKGDIEKLDIESAQESSQIITDIINKNVKEVEADLKTKDQTTGILPKAVRDRINATKKRKTEVDLKGTQVTAQKNVETVLEATSVEDMPKYMDTLLGVKEGVEDIFSFEPKLKHFPKFRNAVRLFKGVSKDARDYSTKAVYSIIGNLDDGEFEVFRKIIALQDIIENGTQGLRLPMDIPLEEYEEALKHYRQYETTNVKRALDKHKELMEAVAYDLVERGKLDEESVREYYYPHRILGNGRLFEAKGVPIRIKKPYRAYAKRRTGSAKLIDMDYIEVMLKHLTRVFIDNAIDDFVNEQATIYNRMPDLSKEKRAEIFGERGPQPNQIYNIDGEEYVAWQYQPGNVFYKAHTLIERAILDALEEGATVEELIEDEKIKKALAVGRKRRMFLLPLEIADKLSSFRKPKEYNGLYQLAVEGVTLWKRIVLDFAGIPYQLNNIIGDAMNLYREDPIAFTKFFEAISALRGNPEFKALIEAAERQRVIDSGFYGVFTQNIDPEIASKLGLKLWPIAKYEQASTFRENILRLAKFMKDMERIQAGKKVVTKTVDIRGLSPEEAAGKVAREAIVDYQGISEHMANMRQFWLPFATFYIENAKSWAKYVAKHPGNLLIKFGVPAVMLYIWNNLIQDDDELPDYFKDQFHINTGFRTADGKLIIISLETPLDIAKNMIGLDKLDDNVKAVLGGDKNILEAARDQALYSIVAVGKRSFLLLNPVLKAGIEIAINKNVFMDSNIVPSRLEGTPEAAKMKANYFVQSLFSPYAQYVRAARDIEPESDFAKWLLKGPLDIKRALGVREVDTEAIGRGKMYDSAAKAEIAYRQNQHKLEQAVIKAVVNEDKEILLEEGQKLVEKGFPVSKKDIDEILSKPRVQAEIIKQKLRKEKDKDERKKLQDMLKKAQQATLMETLKGTPKKARKDIVTKGQ
ncbi:MAG TPA: strawberry notch family protein [Bacillota bacterium]|nr:strawberry notch family protein [Bacillota bacterium]